MNRHYDEHDTGPEWGTPPWVVEPLSDAIGGFDLDPASGAEPHPYADERFTIEDDGLQQDWFGDVWLNPPYGRSHNPLWAEKVSEEANRDSVDTITCLLPASMETNWFQNHYGNGDIFCFIDTRLSFHGSGDSSASFPSVIVLFGEENAPQQFVDVLQSHGLVMTRI